MKVLIVSHNVISKTENMGKTLRSYFQGFAPEDIAQFYIHAEVPTDDSVCRNYYRFTDKDALKSILPIKNHGCIFAADNIQTERAFTRTDVGVESSIYQMGRKRTGGIYLARNAAWKLSHWFTKELRAWIDDVRPDVVFFASGDYAFMYDIAVRIADYAKVPLVITCFDDYYVYNKNTGTALGDFYYKRFMVSVHRAMERASQVLTICEPMANRYGAMFGRSTGVLYTSAPEKTVELNPTATQVSYIGNLGCLRYQQIIAIGQALKALHEKNAAIPAYVSVYSGEKKSEVLQQLTKENGVHFHGQVSADEVLNVMGNSMAVIHTESFDSGMKERVRFSVSTKIAESLMCAPCLIAYGPEDVASIEYVKENHAAYVIGSQEELQGGLEEILTNEQLRSEIIANARKLAHKNHNQGCNTALLQGWLQDVIEGKN